MSVQALEALEQANRVRLATAALKREVAALDGPSATLRVAELLEDPPPAVASARPRDLLCEIDRVGPSRADKLGARAGVTPAALHRRVGPIGRPGHPVLTERQRLALAGALRRAARA